MSLVSSVSSHAPVFGTLLLDDDELFHESLTGSEDEANVLVAFIVPECSSIDVDELLDDVDELLDEYGLTEDRRAERDDGARWFTGQDNPAVEPDETYSPLETGTDIVDDKKGIREEIKDRASGLPYLHRNPAV